MIDACIHHRWESERDVHPYFAEGWRGYVGVAGSAPMGQGARRLAPLVRHENPFGDELTEMDSPGTGPIGSDREAVERHVLGAQAAEKALLLFDRSAMFAPSHPNPYFAAAIAQAINDWNVATWLEKDDRLYGTALVPEQTPTEAAEEIERLAAHPKIAAVTVSPSLGRLLGHPIYTPIHEAAAKHGLPIVLHRGIDSLPDVPNSIAAGEPYTFAEYVTLAPLSIASNLVSLVTNGVLARFPSLKVLVVGAGVSWLEPLLLRLDTVWRSLRRDTPWIQEPPRSYVERQVMLCTYGLEEASDGFQRRVFECCPQLESMVCFGSGFPSWDTTTAEQLKSIIPREWHRQVFHGNAERWLRWNSTESGP